MIGKIQRRTENAFHSFIPLNFTTVVSIITLITISITIPTTSATFNGRANALFVNIRPVSCTVNIITRQLNTNKLTKNKEIKNHVIKTPFSQFRGGSHSDSTNLSMSMSTTFNNSDLWSSIAITSATNIVGCIISLLSGSHIHLDLMGCGAFALATVPALMKSTSSITENLIRLKLSIASVVFWGTKLAAFLFCRALKVRHDKRLDVQLSTASGTIGFWFISALWGIIVALPHSLGLTSSHPGFMSTTITGFSIYSLGLIIESVADYQKWSFKADQANSGRYCNVGIWSISQHPNYFGNLMIWTGILILNAPALIESTITSDSESSYNNAESILKILWGARRLIISFLSPLFLWKLFHGQASGSILDAVKMANDKYGHDPTYKDYVNNLPLIVPRFWRGFKSKIN